MKEPEDKPKKSWVEETDWRGVGITILVGGLILGAIIIGSYNSKPSDDSGDYHGYGWERGY